MSMRKRIRVQEEDFDAGRETENLTRGLATIGAIATFTGVVRGEAGLVSMTLEHYPGMTEREIERHVTEAERRWPILGATIIHRVGRLLPGERVVLVVTASSHRAAAFDSCAFLMDYLKTRAPFWKFEERGGGSQWVDAKASDDRALERWQ